MGACLLYRGENCSLEKRQSIRGGGLDREKERTRGGRNRKGGDFIWVLLGGDRGRG